MESFAFQTEKRRGGPPWMAMQGWCGMPGLIAPRAAGGVLGAAQTRQRGIAPLESRLLPRLGVELGD